MSSGNDISLLFIEEDETSLGICVDVMRLRFPKLIIHSCLSPDEALKTFHEYKHDIVVTDIFSPKRMGGLRVASAICDAKPEAFVIFITGDSNIKLNHLKRNAHIFCLESIIYKPIDLRELLQKIEEAIAIASTRRGISVPVT